MKLYYTDTSPYSRKVRMTIAEKDLGNRVEMIFANPFDDNPDLRAANPLHKVPTLVTDDGAALYDSRVICAYLDEIGGEPRLIPSGAARWRTLTAQALCDGILDAVFALVMERRRPEAQRSTMWQDRRLAATMRACDAAEADLTPFEGPLTLAHLALGAALGYLDFRTPDIDWRGGRPRLAAWYEAFSQRPAMRSSQPPTA